MRQVFRALVAVALFLSCSAGAAEALSVRDVIELSKAGVSDPVLLALIDVDHRVYTLDAASLKELKDAGVSEAVVIAMIRAGRTAAPSPAPVTRASVGSELLNPQESGADPTESSSVSSTEPRIIVIDHHDADTRQVAQPMPVAVPIYIPVQQFSRGHRGDGQRLSAPRASYPVPNYPLGTLAPQQPFITSASQPGVTYSMPNYPLGTIAPQQPFLGVTPVTTPICTTRISAGGAATLVCR